MIMAAHIGVGISGLEGRQAVLAADYAIAQFKFLRVLLLVHGRTAYHRISRLVLYFLYKNFLYAIPTYLYSMMAAMSGTPLYHGFISGFYNVFFTGLPPFSIGMFEEDLPIPAPGEHVLSYHYPGLYRSGQRCQSFNLRRFWRWMLISAEHGLILFIGGVLFYPDIASDGKTKGRISCGLEIYGLAVIIVNAKLAQLLNSWVWAMYTTIGLSIFAWYSMMYIASWRGDQMSDKLINLDYVFQFQLTQYAYWLQIPLYIVACLVFDYFRKGYIRRFEPQPQHAFSLPEELNPYISKKSGIGCLDEQEMGDTPQPDR
jgi:phospholipid-transporting ATPase